VDRWRRIEERLHDPPRLLDAVLAGEAGGVPDHGRMEQDLVRRRPLAALFGELHVERDHVHTHRVRPVRVEDELRAG
jgi:hypothetical protein